MRLDLALGGIVSRRGFNVSTRAVTRRGVAELEAGNYEEALYYSSLHAANGDPRAQYTMGSACIEKVSL